MYVARFYFEGAAAGADAGALGAGVLLAAAGAADDAPSLLELVLDPPSLAPPAFAVDLFP